MFDTTKLTDLRYFFYNCSSLTSLNLDGFNSLNVLRMDYMFYSCSNLRKLDLRSFNLDNILNYTHVFDGCVDLTLIVDSEHFKELLKVLPDNVSYVDYKNNNLFDYY